MHTYLTQNIVNSCYIKHIQRNWRCNLFISLNSHRLILIPLFYLINVERTNGRRHTANKSFLFSIESCVLNMALCQFASQLFALCRICSKYRFYCLSLCTPIHSVFTSTIAIHSSLPPFCTAFFLLRTIVSVSISVFHGNLKHFKFEMVYRVYCSK